MAAPLWFQHLTRWSRQHPGHALGVGALVTLGLAWVFTPAAPPRQAPERPAVATLPPVVPPHVSLEKALAELQRDSASLRQVVQTQQQALEQLRQTQSTHLQHQQQAFSEQRRVLEAALQQVQRQAAAVPKTVASTASSAPVRPVTPLPAPPPAPRLRLLRPSDSGSGSGVAPVDVPGPEAPVYLPAGSFVHATLLTGVFATTQAGGALPALFALQDAFVGPNGSRIPLRGCLALGKTQANLNALRAIVQLTTLSCVLPDGQTVEQPLTGYVTGLDGTLGLPGRLEHREGAFIAKTFLSSLIAGAAAAFAQAEATTQVTPLGGAQTAITGDTGKFAAFSALSGATARLAEFYVGQLPQLLPMVWVESGTRGYAVVQAGLPLPGVPGPARRVSGLD